MMQTHLIYEGAEFIIGGRTVEDVKAEIEEITREGATGWITVNYGQGQLRQAELLLGPGIGVALFEISADTDEPQ